MKKIKTSLTLSLFLFLFSCFCHSLDCPSVPNGGHFLLDDVIYYYEPQFERVRRVRASTGQAFDNMTIKGFLDLVRSAFADGKLGSPGCQPLHFIDSDGDGWSDLAEIISGSDPYDPNSKPWTGFPPPEVQPGMDPEDLPGLGDLGFWFDSDGDGYPDGFELLAGTDPHDPYSWPRQGCSEDLPCYPFLEPWFPYPEDAQPCYTGNCDGKNDGSGNTGGGTTDPGGGTGGGNDNNGGSGSGGNDGNGDDGGNNTGGGNTGDGGNNNGGGDQGNGNSDVDLAGIEGRLDRILSESQQIKSKMGNSKDVDLSGIKSQLNTSNIGLEELARIGRESMQYEVAREQKWWDAVRTFMDTVSDGSIGTGKGLNELQESLNDWHKAWYEARQDDPFVAGFETFLNLFVRNSETTEKHQEKVEHYFELISEQELELMIGEEQMQQMMEKQDEFIASMGRVKDAVENLGTNGDGSDDIVHAIDSQSEIITEELGKSTALLADIAETVSKVDELYSAVREGLDSTIEFNAALQEQMAQNNEKVVSLLSELRDRPDTDLSGVEGRIDEMIEKITGSLSTISVSVEMDLSPIESQLRELREFLQETFGKDGDGDGDGDGEGDGPGWEGLDGWGKPDRTDDMAFKLDLTDKKQEIEQALKKVGLDFDKLGDFNGKHYTDSIRIPIGGTVRSPRWYEFKFDLRTFPPEVDSGIQKVRQVLALLCKGIMGLVFAVKLYKLFWELT